MDLEIFQEIVRILALGGYAVRFLGLLAAGLGVGWLVVSVLKNPGMTWQTQIAVVFVFAAITAMGVRYLTSGALGGYGLGVGAGLLFWGLRQDEYEYVEEDVEE